MQWTIHPWHFPDSCSPSFGRRPKWINSIYNHNDVWMWEASKCEIVIINTWRAIRVSEILCGSNWIITGRHSHEPLPPHLKEINLSNVIIFHWEERRCARRDHRWKHQTYSIRKVLWLLSAAASASKLDDLLNFTVWCAVDRAVFGILHCAVRRCIVIFVSILFKSYARPIAHTIVRLAHTHSYVYRVAYTHVRTCSLTTYSWRNKLVYINYFVVVYY